MHNKAGPLFIQSQTRQQSLPQLKTEFSRNFREISVTVSGLIQALNLSIGKSLRFSLVLIRKFLSVNNI